MDELLSDMKNSDSLKSYLQNSLTIMFCACSIVLSGCVNNPNYTAYNKSVESSSNKKPSSSSVFSPSASLTQANYHIVKKGDTLYSIALRYDLDYRQLARLNQIDSNFTIVPGRRIRLKGEPLPETSAKTNITERKSQKFDPAPPVNRLSVSPVEWIWPVKENILRTSPEVSAELKGIDIRVSFGEAVVAAADGVVVYAGSGLKGYGNLIIVQHSEKFLSAYAYNSEILVKEKQKVISGDIIAKVGRPSRDKVAVLHFEIREEGKPVDPLRFLPRQ